VSLAGNVVRRQKKKKNGRKMVENGRKKAEKKAEKKARIIYIVLTAHFARKWSKNGT
jgi:hypothetical protein